MCFDAIFFSLHSQPTFCLIFLWLKQSKYKVCNIKVSTTATYTRNIHFCYFRWQDQGCRMQVAGIAVPDDHLFLQETCISAVNMFQYGYCLLCTALRRQNFLFIPVVASVYDKLSAFYRCILRQDLANTCFTSMFAFFSKYRAQSLRDWFACLWCLPIENVHCRPENSVCVDALPALRRWTISWSELVIIVFSVQLSGVEK